MAARRSLGLLAGVVALATAPAAAADTLSVRDARRAAERIVAQEERGRDLRWSLLVGGERTSRHRIVFEYASRTRQELFCPAQVVVARRHERRGTVTTTAFRPSACRAVPAEVLGFERAIRRSTRRMRPRGADVLRSLDAAFGSLEGCERVNVPRGRRGEIDVLTSLALLRAPFAPVAAELERFAADLEAVGAGDPALARGAAAWRELLEAVRAIPASFADPCAVIRRWRAAGWSESANPLTDDLALANEQATESLFVIFETAERLERLGSHPRTAATFTVGGFASFAQAPDGLSSRLRSR